MQIITILEALEACLLYTSFKVIHGDKVLNAVALMEARMPEGTWENRETIIKPKILEILAINEDGNIVSIMDEAWMFQFLPIVLN